MAKRIPVRMCIGCGEHKEKRELIRVVRDKEGNLSIDTTGKKPGRGAYLCPNPQCLAKALKSKRLQREFGVPVEDELAQQLMEQMEQSE